MAKDDWFRKTTWEESDQADFWARWRRSRTAYNKAQYLRIQANYLSNRYPAASLEMLEKMLSEFPDSPDVASAELQRGEIFLKQGKLKEAVGALERALAREKVYRNVLTNAWSVFGVAVIQHKLEEHYSAAAQEAKARLDRAIFPAERYFGHAILAVVKKHSGNLESAAEHAQAALKETKIEHSGFRYHPDVGLVENPDEKLVAELRMIASV